jgi:hypothetical protein
MFGIDYDIFYFVPSAINTFSKSEGQENEAEWAR